MIKQHRWSGFPGAFCLDCGNENCMENALCCSKCYIDLDNNPSNDKLCDEHALWSKALETCPPNQELVKEFNAKYP